MRFSFKDLWMHAQSQSETIPLSHTCRVGKTLKTHGLSAPVEENPRSPVGTGADEGWTFELIHVPGRQPLSALRSSSDVADLVGGETRR